MTSAQLQAILADLTANGAIGYVVILDEGVYLSTKDYIFNIESVGGVDTLVGVNKTTDATSYVNIGSIRAVKQHIAPKHAADLTPGPGMNGIDPIEY